MWHCVKNKLNYGMCDGNIIAGHLDFTLREAVGPYGSWQCGGKSFLVVLVLIMIVSMKLTRMNHK